MKKKRLTGIMLACSLLLVLGSSLALFTDKGQSNFKSKMGTVSIILDELFLENQDDINPGDGDPSNPSDSFKGLDHEFSYVLKNEGSKSIRTRQRLVLSAQKDGTDLDARHLKLYDLGGEISNPIYLDELGNEISELGDEKVYAVEYRLDGEVFDGKGLDIDQGGEAEKEFLQGTVKEDEDGLVQKKYSYDFALLREANNDYQEADFHIDVIVEAMQYRNTSEEDWSEAAIVEKAYSSKEFIDSLVPANNEDKDGVIYE